MDKNFITLEIIAIREETDDTKSFILGGPSVTLIRYEPGQFLTLVFPGRINEERRSYSISSVQALDEPLTITVKRVENGAYSRYLLDYCHVGSPVYTIGAAGLFTLPQGDTIRSIAQFCFFAAGSGITPILPLIKTILFRSESRVLLVYSNSAVESTIFYTQLVELRKKFPQRFVIRFYFSNSQNLLHARITKSGIPGLLDQEMNIPFDRVLFYLCGPHAFMQMIGIALLSVGVPAPNIRKEIFDVEKPPMKEVPPDKDEHRVVVRYRGNTYSFKSQYPQTILAAAKSNGIVLPYSCEAGKCGTCAATCSRGQVWMYYNEVLMDKELSTGRILTCTGYAVGGDVELEYPQE